MFRVILYDEKGSCGEYCAKQLQYAKRYADLYRQQFPRIEIREDKEEESLLLETFINGK